MATEEFKAAVEEKKLLRIRIMLKDSLIVDPTFKEFDEMVTYAEHQIRDLYEAFNGGKLENDETKWNEHVMNEELVGLVTNFSKTRISHLKKVVAKVLKSRIEEINCERSKRNERGILENKQKKNSGSNLSYDKKRIQTEKDKGKIVTDNQAIRKRDLMTIRKEINHLSGVMNKIEKEKKWMPKYIDEIEECAKEILNAIEEYKEHK